MNEHEMQAENVGDFWLDIFGVKVGDQIVIIPAGMPQMMQGELLSVIVGQDLVPIAIKIRQTELMPPITVRWAAILMVTVPGAVSAQPPAADVTPDPETMEALRQQVARMDADGIAVPDDIRAMLDTPSEP